MRIQFQEEQAHAMKLYDYVLERGRTVTLEKIDKPKIKWKNIIDVYEDTYAHEQKVTQLINDLVTLSIKAPFGLAALL